MKKLMICFTLISTLMLTLIPSASEAEISSETKIQAIKNSADLPSLKYAYEDYFMLGFVATSSSLSTGYHPFLDRHFSLLATAVDNENADFLIDTAEDEGFGVHGYSLICDEKHFEKLTDNHDNSPISRTEAIEYLKNYIHSVIERYEGQIHSWDVVSGAMRDTSGRVAWRGALKTTGSDSEPASPWWQAFNNGADRARGENGADYIEYAFRFAREADPNAFLHYSDYGMGINSDKAANTAAMIKEINDKWLDEGNTRLLIEGVSFKEHFNLDSDVSVVEQNIRRFINIGVKVAITELDISLCGYEDDELSASDLYLFQAEKYAELMLLFKKHSQHIEFVIFLKTDDFYYALNGGERALSDYQSKLLSDDNFNPRLTYYAVIAPESFLAGDFSTAASRFEWFEESVKIVPFEVEDALNILRYEAELITLTAEQYKRYDLNGDGKVDVSDAIYVLRIVAGLIEQ